MAFKRREEEQPSIFDLAKNPLVPIPFFRFRFPLNKADAFPLEEKHLLSNLSTLNESSDELPFYMGWNQDGLFCEVHYPKQEFTCYPTNIKEGDAIELFIDTRDNKEGNFPTKFCHHFLFFPEKVEGIYGKELTKFRGDNTHDLANSKDLIVKQRETKKRFKRGTAIEIFLPKEILYGFDPEQFARVGFTYRCHIAGEEPQLFSTSPQFSIEQNPSFFASFEMK